MFTIKSCLKVLKGSWLLLLFPCFTNAQTDMDFDMMSKNLFCSGFTYTHSSWTNYWEGTYKRNNLNLGTVTTQMVSYMGNYGVSKKINLLFGLPYVRTKASAGTLSGLDGLQDLSLFVKYKAFQQKLGAGKFALLGVGGLSFPTSNYTADFQPLSIGLRSKNLTGRVIADYSIRKYFITGSGTYMHRSNITIDRDAYYTTRMHNTNTVEMPDAASFNVRTGFRTGQLRVEALFTRFITLGGFDITRNNMPFPSNRMNASMAGIGMRYVPKKLSSLHISLEGNRTISGRNMGEATTVSGGVFYIFNFNKKNVSQN